MKKTGFLFSILIIISLTVAGQTNLNSGLVAYYPFDGNVNDASGNNNNGFVYGATLTSDRFGNENKAIVIPLLSEKSTSKSSPS